MFHVQLLKDEGRPLGLIQKCISTGAQHAHAIEPGERTPDTARRREHGAVAATEEGHRQLQAQLQAGVQEAQAEAAARAEVPARPEYVIALEQEVSALKLQVDAYEARRRRTPSPALSSVTFAAPTNTAPPTREPSAERFATQASAQT